MIRRQDRLGRVGHVRLGGAGGMAGIRGALDACDHRDRLDRLVVLLHRAGPRACTATATSPRAPMARNGRSMAAASIMSRNTSSRPTAMPDDLIWFKWESYSTWLTGFAHAGAGLLPRRRPVPGRPGVADLAVWQAIAISLASLAFGWVVYDLICKSPLRRRQHAADDRAVCDPGGDGLGLYPGLLGPRGAAASRRVHRDDHDRRMCSSSSCRTSGSSWPI